MAREPEKAVFPELPLRRICLRRLRPGDGAAFHAYRSAPDVAKFQFMCPESPAEAERFVIRQQKVAFDTPGTWSQIGIELNAGSRLIGDLGVHFLEDDSAQVELGFTIAPEFQRNGYGAEAVAAMMGHLFGKCGKHRLLLKMDPGNEAARGLAGKLGFRQEAHFVQSFRIGVRWTDEIVCAILRAEWERQNQ